MQISSVGFRTDVMLRSLAGARITDRGDFLEVRTDANPGFRWGNFVLVSERAVQEGVEQWVQMFDGAFPEARRIAIGLDTAGDTPVEGASDAGLTVEVSSVLTASAASTPAPQRSDAEVRALRTDEEWAQALRLRQRLDENENVDSNSDYSQFVERRLAEARRLTEAGHGVWIGAFISGHMRAGLGLFSDGQGIGRYQDVDTDPDYRRRGLASQLICHAAQSGLHDLGAHTLVIVADPDYHAHGLYRRLGFVDTELQTSLSGERA